MLQSDDTSSDCKLVTIVSSFDPNAKSGVHGFGSAHFLTGDPPLPYQIYFTNLDTATAPAQSVRITDQLDPTKVDLSTFSFSQITFADQIITPPPGQTQFTTDVDLRPAKTLIVHIEARLDTTTGLITWKYSSIDPATGQPVTDPTAGFLPPDITPPQGEGSVLFYVNPKSGLATGTQITNQAQVVFDQNAPINTQPWLNTIDNSKPSSQVLSLTPTQSTCGFNVQWSGTDLGSGIQSYTIYVSDNGGAFTAWQQDTRQTSATFNGQPGHTYSFYSIATDGVGNTEDAPSSPDAVTSVPADTTAPTITAIPSSTPNAAGWYNQNVSVNLNASDGGACNSGVSQIIYSASGAQTINSTTVNGASTSLPITTEGTTTIIYQAKDNAGNLSAPQMLVIKLDKTPPSVTCAAADGQWHASDVSIKCTATDGNSSLANAADSSFSLSTNVPAGTETSNAQTNSRSVCDKAGNCAMAGPIGGNRVDKKGPGISILSPASVTYNLGQLVVANYSCADGGVGLQSCTAAVNNRLPVNFLLPVTNLFLLDTLLPGTRTLTVTATDKLGNRTSQSVTYTVAAHVASSVPTADLSITMTAPSQVSAGQNITYTIKVKNNGPSSVPNADLYNLEIPQGTTLVGAATTQGLLKTPDVGSQTGLITGTLGALNKRRGGDGDGSGESPGSN